MARAPGGRRGLRRDEPGRRPCVRVGRSCAGADRARPAISATSASAGREQAVTTLLAVLVGGLAGAVARQELFRALQERAGTRFPVGILAVNLSGAFLLGLLYGLDIAGSWPDWLAIGAQTGLIGAYTTYSTWAVDSLALIRDGAARSAVVNLAGSLAAGVPLAWGGASVGSAI